MVSQRRSKVEIVRFEDVSLLYAGGHHVLHGLSFSLTIGDFYFLTGLSGAGKTSLLKLMYRGIKPTQGTVKIFGRDISRLSENELPQFRQRIGLVFQDCRLIPHLNVVDNVALALKIAGTDSKRARAHAVELLQWAGLGNHLTDDPTTLSDGQKQRVAIARAVITRPLLLLADEPTGNLDHQAAVKLIHLFEELNKIGTTVLVATHNHALVTEFGYPELCLHQGQLMLADRSEAYHAS